MTGRVFVHRNSAFEWTIPDHHCYIIFSAFLQNLMNFIHTETSHIVAINLQDLITKTKSVNEKKNISIKKLQIEYFEKDKIIWHLPNKSSWTIFANQRDKNTVVNVSNAQTDFLVGTLANGNLANAMCHMCTL